MTGRSDEVRAGRPPITDASGNPAIATCYRCEGPIFAAGGWAGPVPAAMYWTCGCWTRGFTPHPQFRPRVVSGEVDSPSVPDESGDNATTAQTDGGI
jgi:hypothetical protein